MNNQEIKTMEGEILSAEDLPEQNNSKTQEPKPKVKKRVSVPDLTNLPAKLAALKETIKKPRFIIIVSLILIIPVIYLAFTMLGTNTNTQIPLNNLTPDFQSPNPIIDKNREVMENKVKLFRNELETLETETKDLTFPDVDLNVKF